MTGDGGTGQNPYERLTWSGLSSLSPSLQIANLSTQQQANRYTFDSGVFYGVTAASGVALAENIWKTYLEPRLGKADNRDDGSPDDPNSQSPPVKQDDQDAPSDSAESAEEGSAS
jgi:hypothetical protein